MSKPRILSVDDEVSFTEMMKMYFEPRGYAIDVASDGEKGVELLRANAYDVALLDLKMVGLNGDEIMNIIVNEDLPSKPKIIFITAFSDSGKTQTQLMDQGAYAFVEKPISSLKSLEELVNEAASSNKSEE